MKNFIIKIKFKNYIFILFWLIIWHILSVIIGEDIILTSPISVLKRVFTLILEPTFFLVIFNSITNIIIGFIIGAIIGLILAIICKKIKTLYNLFLPPITFIKVTPIGCFIILVLMWIRSDKLSILISFFMSLPIFFFNIYNGIDIIEDKILQMAKIYKITNINRIKYIYFPYLFKIIVPTCTLGFSMSWKAGIAAEIIGMSNFSIGGKLQDAKVLLETNDVLAWTVIIIFINGLIENLIKYIIDITNKYLIGVNNDRD